jgi:hypothetical protein
MFEPSRARWYRLPEIVLRVRVPNWLVSISDWRARLIFAIPASRRFGEMDKAIP